MDRRQVKTFLWSIVSIPSKNIATLNDVTSVLFVINVKKILAVINATYAVAKRKPEKNQACRDLNPDLCDTGAAL